MFKAFLKGYLIAYGYGWIWDEKDLKKLMNSEGDLGFREMLIPFVLAILVIIVVFIALAFYFYFMIR